MPLLLNTKVPTSEPSKLENGVKGDAEVSDDPENLNEKAREKVVHVDRIWDKKTRTFRYVKTAKPKKEKFARYVITVARSITSQGVFSGEYITDIRGRYLCKALSDIYSDISSISFADQKITLDTEELKLLFHAYDRLKQKLKEAETSEFPNSDEVFELSAALEFIPHHYSREISELSELPENDITFALLWTLVPPHTLLHSIDDLGQGRVQRVLSSAYKKEQDGSLTFQVVSEYLDFDGQQLGFVCTMNSVHAIGEFRGTMSILDLPASPLHRQPERKKTEKDLIGRGERILELHGRHLCEYQGHALGPRNREGKRIKFNSHGRVMLDPGVFEQVSPNNDHVPTIRKSIRQEDMTDEYKMLINPVLYGFSLGDKMWGGFAVNHLDDVDWNNKVIDALVLPQQQKDFIRALVRTHGLPDNGNFDDFVRDKGRGLIGLLAGPPGVGKTLTAEAVAEIARRPLYMLSSGELGESSESVQKKLNEVLEITEAWGAVLLLDEADVFLAKRDDVNLTRNAITSIFLRQLEYYQGIMLLTTNRSTSFDPAFESRIHFRFEYEDLSVVARENIFRAFFEKMGQSGGQEVVVSDEEINQLANLPLNGRQIKNVMSISQAVAKEKKVKLTIDIIRLAERFTQSSLE